MDQTQTQRWIDFMRRQFSRDLDLGTLRINLERDLTPDQQVLFWRYSPEYLDTSEHVCREYLVGLRDGPRQIFMHIIEQKSSDGTMEYLFGVHYNMYGDQLDRFWTTRTNLLTAYQAILDELTENPASPFC